ncbi:MAG: ATP-grasp domain-containing protein [Candidatus Omnitrophica bacterium]|nr:ATP-grasp domain-containing protein [Candidatus Omnitrophota bacterium]MCM8826728.1 ATP-grasp domain-containing protein [Candidatus Omnitrophota bacterium]
MTSNRVLLITISGEKRNKKDVKGAWQCKRSLEEVFLKKGLKFTEIILNKRDFENRDNLKKKILNKEPACIFNLFEGFSGDSYKEAEFVEILEELGVPFTGNNYYALKTCLNKAKVKEVLKKEGIPTPNGLFVREIKDVSFKDLLFPVFIKPCFDDASIGIDRDSLVKDRHLIEKVLVKKLRAHPQGLIVEEFIPGKEYNVGFLGDYPYELLGISVIDYSKYKDFTPFLTYNSKWEEDSEEYKILIPSCNEKIDEDLKKKILNISLRAGKILGCRSYFRIDLREKDGKLFVLDINPNPDINKDSGLMKQAYHKGYTYEDIIEKILIFSGYARR